MPLRPTPLERSRLADAIAEVTSRWEATSGVQVDLGTTGTERWLHPEVEVTLLRVTQEALANVAKHSSANKIGITLSYMGELVTLDVRDDGVGFAPAAGSGRPGDSFGLEVMRQRVERLGGMLDIESEPGMGTAIFCTDPGRSGGTVSEPIGVLIVDDHPVVRDGLKGMFAGEPGFTVVGEASDGDEAVAKAAVLQPDVVLMDLRMPGTGGVQAIGMLAQRGIESRVLILTTFDTEADVLPAIEAGATGYLLWDAPRQDLLRAVRAAARGEAVLSPAIATRLLGQVRRPAGETVSERELEVLRLVARGSTNREAADRLFISEATVKTHLLHIYAKLGVNDRAAAVATAYERGLLTPGDA
jgi:DNA-binding NarL/FixJ family response regulator